MTNVYEYEHPIINNNLAISNENSNPRKFPNLQSWYNVINDYEFKARCPIILKNSHRNKHFTFACHLKNCDFKVLLSYCGNAQTTNTTTKKDSILFDEDDLKHNHLVTLNDEHEDKKDHDIEDDTIRKYTETDATTEDATVTAAIAAAVANIQQDSTHSNDIKPHITKEQINNTSTNTSHTDLDDTDALLEHSVRFINEDPVEGPFIVTKIYPYHNHPLEHNMALDKFVLTKIPKILQNDLNFDTTLEDLYKKGNNSMNKFKVSLFVTESGLLDIIKQRYHLTDNEISRKFISLISRRVTTYKARFVLKKKKMGEYQDHNSNIHMLQQSQSTLSPPTSPSTKNSNSNSNNNNNNNSDTNNALSPNQALINVTKKMYSTMESSTNKNTTTPTNNNSKIHTGLLSDQAVMELNNASSVLPSDLQHAAQAAINENILLSKRRLTNDDTDLETFKRLKSNNNNNITLDDINIGDLNGEEKLPEEVADQLRLLSSHFKDPDNLGQTSLNNTTFDDDVTQQHHHHHQIHGNSDELGPPIGDDDNDDDDVVVNTNNLVHHPDDVVDEQILDENIQPELRGQ